MKKSVRKREAKARSLGFKDLKIACEDTALSPIRRHSSGGIPNPPTNPAGKWGSQSDCWMFTMSKASGKKIGCQTTSLSHFFSSSEPNFKNFNSCILHLYTSYSTLLLKFLYSHLPPPPPPTPTKSPGSLFISYLFLICPCQSPHQGNHSDSPLLEHLWQSIIITYPQMYQ